MALTAICAVVPLYTVQTNKRTKGRKEERQCWNGGCNVCNWQWWCGCCARCTQQDGWWSAIRCIVAVVLVLSNDSPWLRWHLIAVQPSNVRRNARLSAISGRERHHYRYCNWTSSTYCLRTDCTFEFATSTSCRMQQWIEGSAMFRCDPCCWGWIRIIHNKNE